MNRPLRPFFSFFGGKWTLAPHYPEPTHGILVEPFAGSAGYATRYPDREVVLVEREPVVASLWRWLIGVSVDEVMGIPLDPGERHSLRPEAAALVGFWCARGRTRPAMTTGSRWLPKWKHSFWGESIRARIAAQVPRIRHWRLIEGDYSAAPDVEATWFLDPPYEAQQARYRARVGDYGDLARWARHRSGQVIVCEQAGATWLPFVSFRTTKNISRGVVHEVVWTA